MSNTSDAVETRFGPTEALFEEKIAITPKDMNRLSTEPLNAILLKHLRDKLENKCSIHGFVLPKTLEILSRSMGLIENGRYTGNVMFHIQAQGKVYNPSNGVKITSQVMKKNKMGLYIIYEDAIRILIPRDLHLGNEEFEAVQPGDTVEVEIRKSRFQVNDPFILSVGIFLKRVSSTNYSSESNTSNSNSNSNSNSSGSNTNSSNSSGSASETNENENNDESENNNESENNDESENDAENDAETSASTE